MGLFNFLRKQEPEPEFTEELEEIEELESEDVNAFLKQLAHRSEGVEETYEQLNTRITQALDTLKQSLNSLERAAFTSDERMASAVNMAKDAFIKRAHSSLVFHQPDTLEYKKLENMGKELHDMLHYFSQVSPKQIYFLSTYFKEQSDAVIEAIKTLEQEIGEFKTFLDTDARVLDYLDILKERTGGLSEKTVMLEKLWTAEKKLTEEIQELIEKKMNNEEQLKDFMESKEWGEVEDVRDRIEEQREALEAMEEDFNRIATGAKKAFKKTFHKSKKPFSLPQNPFEEYVLIGKTRWVMDAIDKAITLADDRGLKPTEVKKVEALEKEVRSSEQLKVEHMKIKELIEEGEREIKRYSGFFDGKKEVEEGLEETQKRLEQAQQELEDIREQKDRIKQTETEERLLIEKLMSEAAKRNVKLV